MESDSQKSQGPIRVSIVDDDDGIRNNLCRLLASHADFECVSTHPHGRSACAEIPKIMPDVVMMDINLGSMDGIECVARLKAAAPQLQIVMLTVYEETEKIYPALEAGAAGYLLTQILVELPGYTDELRAEVGNNVSIESSVAVSGDRAYFANSGGRVVGLDISDLASGEAPVVFDYWVGDDVDATVVVDADGILYVAAELERGTERSLEVGQLVKLDPRADGDPRVWGVPVPAVDGGDGGIWATPALHDGHVYVPTHTGRLLAVDAADGEITWEDDVGPHAWSSPAVVDGVLLVATCDVPELRAYSLATPGVPEPLWTLSPAAGGCIESTPAVWEGRIYVGSRDGFVRAYG